MYVINKEMKDLQIAHANFIVSWNIADNTGH